jgi:serine/threonine protein kinase
MIHGSEEDVSQVVRVLKQWPTRHDTYLLRYQLQEAVHKSRTSEVFYAYDVTESRPVCLKLMKDFSSFEREIRTRLEQTIAPDCVVEVLGWHTEERCPLSVEVNTPAGRVVRTEEPQWTDCNAKERWPFVLVMAPAERSLLDCFSKEQLAGVNHPVVVATICSILRCVEALHEAGLVHGDLKPRNILRQDHFDLQHTTMPDVDAAAADSVGTDSQNADKWILCDLDATASVQCDLGDKTSSAYAPPECQYDAREKRHRKVGERVPAAKSYDVWSLGIIIFELVSGVRLFRQDLCNDDLSETADRTRLQVWHTIDDEELAPVFEKADSKLVSNEQKQQAKALIRWCLKGDPNERPTVQQMLGHPFLGGKDPPREMPMLYFAFLSHCQADASGTVATLYQLLKRKGLHCWYDMRQRVLTLKGMRKGVCDSDVFIFLLSSRVLDSWFCQQELLCAIEHKKRIQLVVEADPRFNPFDVAQWNAERESYAAQAATAGSSDRRLYSETRSEAGGRVEVLVEPDERYAWQTKQGGKKLAELIAQAIDDNLPKAVTFRRRDFEQDAMLRELCRRNGKELPDEEPQETRPGHPIRVLVIHNERSNNRDSPPQRMHRLLEALEDNGEDDICLCDSSTDLSSVHCVLLLLVPGVLGGATLVALQDALRYDREQQTDRIIAVCDQSWNFRGPEATEAPQDVQACLSSHEAIVFRPRTNDEAGDCHEHPAMMKQLLLKLRMAARSER